MESDRERNQSGGDPVSARAEPALELPPTVTVENAGEDASSDDDIVPPSVASDDM